MYGKVRQFKFGAGVIYNWMGKGMGIYAADPVMGAQAVEETL